MSERAHTPPDDELQRLRQQLKRLENIEQELSRERDLIASIMETSPVGIVKVDASGQITFANARAVEVLGLSKQHLTQTTYNAAQWHITDLEGGQFPEEQLPFRQVMTTGKPVFDVRHAIEWPGGRRVLLSVNAAPLLDDDGEMVGMVATVDDISERVHALQALARENSFREAIIDNVGDGLCVCHQVEEYPFVNFTVWNQRMEEITGYSLEEINRQGWYQTVYPDPEVQALAVERMSRMRTGDDIHGEEWTITCKDGSEKPLLISTKLLETSSGEHHVLALMHDLSRAKQAQRQLQENEERFRALIENAVDIIGIVDRDLVSQYASPSVRLLGYAQHEVIGQRLNQFIHPDDLASVEHAVAQATRHPGTPIGMEDFRVVAADGAQHHLEGTVTCLFDTPGVDGYVFNGRDITLRVQVEQERLQLTRQLEQTQKLESLGILAGGVAHDFNNLLTGVLGNADLALTRLPPASAARREIQRVVDAARRAAELSKQMLAYSGKGRLLVEAVDLTQLIQDLERLLHSLVEKKTQLVLDLTAEPPAIEADVSQMRQIVVTLLTNAAEAIDQNDGVITVSTSVVEASRALLEGTFINDNLPPGPYVRLAVTDTGCGMDDAVQRKIFDPFFTTKFTGRGLGLAALLGIVRSHHGAVKVTSVPGAGTTCEVLLPVATDDDAPDLSPTQHAPSEQSRGAILLIDDEEIVRETAAEMIREAGFEVLTACDGLDGIDKLRDNVDAVSLVILDMNMPRLSGEEALPRLLEINPEIKVVLSSGYDERVTMEQCNQSTVAGFIQKPYSLVALAGLIQSLLDDRE